MLHRAALPRRERLEHAAHLAHRHPGIRQPHNPLLGGPRREERRQLRPELLAALDPLRIRAEPLVVGELGPPEGAAEPPEETVVGSGYGDRRVQGLERLVRDDVRVRVAVAPGLAPGHERGLRDVRQRGLRDLEQRDLDMFATAREQRGENRRRRGIAGEHVHDRHAHLYRFARTGDRHQPAFGLEDEVVAGPVVAEAADRAVDEIRIFLRKLCVADAEPVARAAAKVLDDDVGVDGEPPCHLVRPGPREVEGDAALAAVHREEVRRLTGRVRRPPRPRLVPLPGPLDLDHVRAEVGEQHRAVRARQHTRQIEHPEGQHRGIVRRCRQPGSERIGRCREDRGVDDGLLLLLVGAVLAASIVVALGAARTGLPVLVAFLGLGMLLGSDGPGGIAFDDAHLARRVGTVGLGLILYEGGLQTSWRRLREVAVPAAILSTVGVVVSMLVTGAGARFLFDLSWLEALLLGAVVASTDAAAVFATLRSTHVRRRLARTLEAESGGNDPMAIALTLGLIAWIEQSDYGTGDLVLLVTRQLGLGLVIGIAAGAAASWVFARIPPAIGAFAPVASIAAAALAFGAADTIGGSGFLAVYLVGLAVGSTPSRYRRQLVAFHEGVAFIAQVTLFVVLGLLVFPHDLPDVALQGLALASVLVLLARPAAVWASTAFSRYTNPERLLLGWAGLRGAVPIVLATFALSAQVPHRETIFNAVFFVVLVSMIVQGTTLEQLARRLALVSPAPPVPEAPLEVGPLSKLELIDFAVAPDHAVNGSAVRELGLPRNALIAVINRDGETIPPRGSTVVRAGDRLFVLVPRANRADLEDVFSRWRRRV